MPSDPDLPARHSTLDANQTEELFEGSVRSRASSVISTGTKLSVLTLPVSDAASQREHSSHNVLLHEATRLQPRPLSLYSFGSEALPAYSENQSTLADDDGAGDEDERPSTSYHVPGSHNSDLHHHHDAENQLEEEPDDDFSPPTPTSMSNDPENSLSRHYGRIVRTIDENNFRLIARLKADHAEETATMRHTLSQITVGHAQEVASLRSEIDAVRNDVDAEYRKVLKQRNKELERNREVAATRESELETEVEKMRALLEESRQETAAANQEVAKKEMELRGEMEEKILSVTMEKDAEIDSRCAKARHVVEDLWEERWQRRNELAAEEAKRSEREWRETMRVVVEEREERWRDVVGGRFGAEELEIMQRVVDRGGMAESASGEK